MLQIYSIHKSQINRSLLSPTLENSSITLAETSFLQMIIALQKLEGCWILVGPLWESVGFSVQHKASQSVDLKVWATLLAITFLEGTVVEKASDWLKSKQETERTVCSRRSGHWLSIWLWKQPRSNCGERKDKSEEHKTGKQADSYPSNRDDCITSIA